MTRTIIQLYRGTTAQNDAFTGSAGELSFDTTTNQVRVHDGTTVGGHIIGSGGGYHPDLFSWQWADHELNDVQWLRADTFSWQSGAVYQAAYQHLVDDIDGKTLQSETIGSTTIQFYLADDGHKICPASEETNVNYIYGTSGVAWYYVIDTVNQRFKLPRTQFGVTGYRGTVGGYIEAGLPNITGAVTNSGNNDDGPLSAQGTGTGAFQTTSAGGNGASGENGTGNWNFNFDASRSSSVYGNASTVQPKATQMYLYFYVGNFTQTALENTAGINASLFNGKADVSALNAATAHVVIETQEPTSANNYTWYRLYADGWVEQGGRVQSTSVDYEEQTVTFPIEMADIGYMVTITPESSFGNTMEARGFCFFNPTTTSMKVAPQVNTITWGNYWQVSGKAA